MEKYSGCTVKELKNQLNRRVASLKGKKKDLLERLYFYDTNNNFVQSNASARTDEDCSEATFLSPNDNDYRDINANTIIPLITKKHVTLFLDRFSVKKDLGKRMYECGYLLCARIATLSNCTFLRGYCQAQMKKNVQYVVDIRLSSSGFIEATHCECAVGSGITAHCKHVAVLLWAMEHMGREKKIICKRSCTEQLQSFHKPKKAYFGTPLKAEKLPKNKRSVELDEYNTPLDLECVDAEAYNRRIRNLCINFSAVHKSTMPIMHLFQPANLYAAVWDHCYTAIDPEEQLLHELKLLGITDDMINEIEEETRGQADNKKWHEYRRHRITASHFHTCCITRTPEQQNAVVQRILNPTPFKSKATIHWQLNESVAIAACESLGVKIDTCGLFISKSQPYLGASPDGLIGEQTIVEVKCPFAQRNSVIDENTIPYLYRDTNGDLRLCPDHPYFYQIQGQLLVTGRLMAKLVVFTHEQIAVIDVPRDETAIVDMKTLLSFFYTNYFKPALLEEYIYKGYRTIFQR